MKKAVFLSLLPAISLGAIAPAHAWFPQGHSIVASAAVKTLPEDVPAWFREDKGQVAHDAQDPDVQKNRDLPFMSDAEGPQHYMDMELLQGRPLPTKYADFLKLCQELKIEPSNIGEVPYAIAEWTQRLTMDFAEARRYPNNPYIRNKTLVTAGILSHYAGDVCMPLHTTLSHDGRALPDGTSPRSGIHAKVDSLIERLDLKPEALAKDQKAEAFPNLFTAIQAQMKNSFDLVEKTYQLEPQLPATTTGAYTPSADITAFTNERARTAAKFTASLFLTAWRDSEKIKLPTWLKREE